MTSTPNAELSSIIAQIEELMNRVTSIGDEYRNTPDSQFVAEINSAERSLMSTLRALRRSQGVEPS